jgi:hypothetical protein
MLIGLSGQQGRLPHRPCRLPILSQVAPSQAFDKHGHIAEMVGEQHCMCEHKVDDNPHHHPVQPAAFAPYRQWLPSPYASGAIGCINLAVPSCAGQSASEILCSAAKGIESSRCHRCLGTTCLMAHSPASAHGLPVRPDVPADRGSRARLDFYLPLTALEMVTISVSARKRYVRWACPYARCCPSRQRQ